MRNPFPGSRVLAKTGSMREIAYAGGTFLTGDEVARVLMEYAAQLANANRAATVHVPAIGPSGDFVDVAVVIGPSSQLMSEAVASAHDDPDPTDFTAEVSERVERLTRSPAIPRSTVDWDI